MAKFFGAFWLGIAFLATLVHAECKCSGLDYTNGGSYFIDQSSKDVFTFTSLFEGK
jgi:hypothetical protein